MSETKSSEIVEKDVIAFLTNRKYFFVDDMTEEQLYFKTDRSGYIIDGNDTKQPFSWVYVSDKNTLKIVLPNKKVMVFVIQEIVPDELLKVIYADKETKRNTYLIKKDKDIKVTTIKSMDLVGFEVNYLWSDSQTKNIYSFFEDGDGIIIPPNDEEDNIDFKWYIDESNIIKIGFQSKIISIMLEEKLDDNFYTIKLDDNTVKYENVNFTRITVKEEETNSVLDTKAEKPEKIFLTFLGSSLFIISIVALQIMFLTRGMSILIKFIIALAIALFFVLKFKSYFVMICKKDRLKNKGRKFGKLINFIDKTIVKPIEKTIYK